LIVITFGATQSALLIYLSELQLLTFRELKFSTGPTEGPSYPPHLEHCMAASEFYDPFSYHLTHISLFSLHSVRRMTAGIFSLQIVKTFQNTRRHNLWDHNSIIQLFLHVIKYRTRIIFSTSSSPPYPPQLSSSFFLYDITRFTLFRGSGRCL